MSQKIATNQRFAQATQGALAPDRQHLRVQSGPANQAQAVPNSSIEERPLAERIANPALAVVKNSPSIVKSGAAIADAILSKNPREIITAAFGAAGALLGVIKTADKFGGSGKPARDSVDFARSPQLGQLQETTKNAYALALDVLNNPGKTKQFGFGDARLGKKDTKAKIKESLKELQKIENPDDSVKLLIEDMKDAFKDVSSRLNEARQEKVIGLSATTCSVALAILKTIGTCGASGLELVDPICDILQHVISAGCSIEEAINVSAAARKVVVDADQLQSLSQNARDGVRNVHGLALEILNNPKQTKGFAYGDRSDPSVKEFGKKAAKKILKRAGVPLAAEIENRKLAGDDDTAVELSRVGEDTKEAYKSISRRLNKARAKKAIKITTIVTSVISSVCACIVTGGAATPIVVAGLTALTVGIDLIEAAHSIIPRKEEAANLKTLLASSFLAK